MPMFEYFYPVRHGAALCMRSAALASLLVLAGSALALDAELPADSRTPAELFPTIRDALRKGVQDLNAGDKAGAARALQYAAQGGNAAAQYKLGRMYALGDGVPHDDYKAFRYFAAIANGSKEETPEQSGVGLVSKAYVALASYYLDGIKGSPIKPNPARAQEFFQYAATYHGDADAQYGLARMLLDGAAGTKDPLTAARWLGLAAEKGHTYAQAVLGRLLFTGDGVARQGPLGLRWLSSAKETADPVRDAWVIELYEKAFAASTEDERRLAERFSRRQQRSLNQAARPLN
jgi:uncharacterized protein